MFAPKHNKNTRTYKMSVNCIIPMKEKKNKKIKKSKKNRQNKYVSIGHKTIPIC